VAFAVGNGAMLQNLARLKTNVDSGMFLALQRTAITALAPTWSVVWSWIQRRCRSGDGEGR